MPRQRGFGTSDSLAWEIAMPAYRIVYRRNETRGPETIVASFNDLDHALTVFAARGLAILYIAEATREVRTLGSIINAADARQQKARKPSSFPLRRFSARAMA
jgi:hypothetical protein